MFERRGKLTALRIEGPAGHAEYSHMSVIYAVLASQSLFPSYMHTESSDIISGLHEQLRRSLDAVYELLHAAVESCHRLQLAAIGPHDGPRTVVGVVA
jgi:hypothetical protein